MRVVQVVNEISQALKEQSVASNDIALNVERIAQSASGNARAARQVGAGQLVDARSDQRLHHAVHRFLGVIHPRHTITPPCLSKHGAWFFYRVSVRRF